MLAESRDIFKYWFVKNIGRGKRRRRRTETKRKVNRNNIEMYVVQVQSNSVITSRQGICSIAMIVSL